MKRDTVLKHEFVEFIPDELEQGTIYVSIRFATASHVCCCGCGSRVVTPIRPTDWRLVFDGKTVSLDPSIGNWNFPCQSHYWIKNNQVTWAPRWNMAKIALGRLRDRDAKKQYFGDMATTSDTDPKNLETRRPKRTRRQKPIKEGPPRYFGARNYVRKLQPRL